MKPQRISSVTRISKQSHLAKQNKALSIYFIKHENSTCYNVTVGFSGWPPNQVVGLGLRTFSKSTTG